MAHHSAWNANLIMNHTAAQQFAQSQLKSAQLEVTVQYSTQWYSWNAIYCFTVCRPEYNTLKALLYVYNTCMPTPFI